MPESRFLDAVARDAEGGGGGGGAGAGGGGAGGMAGAASRPAALDFTVTDPTPPDKLAPPPTEKPWDPEPSREKVRARVAYMLTFTVCGLAVAAFALLAAGWISGDEIDHAQFFFTPVITLAGTALGFYFGGRTTR